MNHFSADSPSPQFVSDCIADAVLAARRILLKLDCEANQIISSDALKWLFDKQCKFESENSALRAIEYPVIWVGQDLPDWAANLNKATGSPEESAANFRLQHCHEARASELLGSSQRLIVYDAREHFNPNVFASSINTLCGGGICVLLTDQSVEAKINSAADKSLSSYSAYLQTCFDDFQRDAPEHLIQCSVEALNQFLSNDETDQCLGASRSESRLQSHAIPLYAHANKGQQYFVKEALHRFDSSRDKVCLSLEAKRGRGKSAALAWLVEQWLEENSRGQVWLCAPSKKQVRTQMSIWSASSQKPLEKIRFHAIDELLERLGREPPAINKKDRQSILLVIDEAAAISLSLLKGIAAMGFNLALATTTEGYEGSGRGFLLRFKQFLKASYSSYHEFQLEEPIRWSRDDRIEMLVEDICGLGWSSSIYADVEGDVSSLAVQKLSPDELLADKSLLKQVYGLLVEAHYQTQPSDLQRLLDDKSLHLWVALDKQRRVLGVLQTVEEGGFATKASEALANEVAMGRRRPAGNLVAQRLAYHYNDPTWCLLNSLRVMRIAVAASFQRRSIGTALIRSMSEWARHNLIDFWSSSFGYTSELNKFWSEQQAFLVYLGSRVEKSSGSYNAMVVCPLITNPAKPFKYESFSEQFSKEQNRRGLLNAAALTLGSSSTISLESLGWLDTKEQARLARFANRGWDIDAALPLIIVVLYQLSRENRSLEPDAALLFDQLLAHAPDWKTLAQLQGQSGKAEFVEFLRAYLAQSNVLDAS